MVLAMAWAICFAMRVRDCSGFERCLDKDFVNGFDALVMALVLAAVLTMALAVALARYSIVVPRASTQPAEPKAHPQRF